MPASPSPAAPLEDAPAGDTPDPLFDARLLGRAARPVRPLLTSLERSAAIRPLLAAALILPAVLATADCRLDAIEPRWGLECLEAAAGRDPLPRDDATGPPPAGAWLTGFLLRATGTGRPVGYFLLPWAAAVLLAGTVWGAAATACGPRAAALTVVLVSTHPALVAAAATTPPTLLGVALAGGAIWAFCEAARGGGRTMPILGATTAAASLLFAGPAVIVGPVAAASLVVAHVRPPARGPLLIAAAVVTAAGSAAWWWRGWTVGMWEVGGPSDSRLRPSDPTLWLAAPLAVFGAAGLLASLRSREPHSGVSPVPTLAWAATAAGLSLTGHRPAVWLAAVAVAVALAAAWMLERTCRREVAVRLALLLTGVPVLCLWVAQWLDGDPIGLFLRAALLAGLAVLCWAVWRMLAHRWTDTRRARRLLIVAVAGLVACQFAAGMGAASAPRPRGGRELAAAVRPVDASTVVLVAPPDRRDAARFLVRAVRPDPNLRVLVFAPGEPRVADLLARRSASGERTVLIAVGGGAWAWLTDRLEVPPDLFRPAGAVGNDEALLLRVGGQTIEVAREALAGAE